MGYNRSQALSPLMLEPPWLSSLKLRIAELPGNQEAFQNSSLFLALGETERTEEPPQIASSLQGLYLRKIGAYLVGS